MKKMLKKTLMVSNSWRPEGDLLCGKCGDEIEYVWGDYSFRYYEQKDKSDLSVICKSCAVEMKNNDKKLRVITRSPIMDIINLKNSGWKSQPKGQGFSGFGGGAPAKVDPSDEENADE